MERVLKWRPARACRLALPRGPAGSSISRLKVNGTRENLAMLRSYLRNLVIALLAAVVSALPYHGNAWAAQHAEAPIQEGQAAAPAHGAGAAEKPNPMEVQPALAVWTVVVFVCLFLLLGRFAWKPLIQALHQREEHLEHCLLQTEKARNESEGLLAEHRRLLAQADERIKSILDKAHKDAQATADDIIRQAQAEASAARDRAQREIATARDQALVEIWSQTAAIAVSVAGRVLTKELSTDEHRRLLDLAIKELPAAPVSANGHGHGGAHA
jgi:F-type H+-transporting ATPase subunit b